MVRAGGLFLAGAATGVAVVALHPLWWGLLLGAVAVVSATVALPAGWWTRLPFGAGFALATVVFAVGRPEGDFVVSADFAGYALIGLVLVVLVLSLVTLPRPGRGSGAVGTPT